MGHVHSGYHLILNTIKKELEEHGVIIRTGALVSEVNLLTDETWGMPIRVMAGDEETQFDRVLYTLPCPLVLQSLKGLDEDDYRQQMDKVNYLGVACVFLVLTRKLSPYYVINLLDKELPFTGIIEATNVVPPQDIRGKHLVYLPKYMPESDPLNSLNDEQIIKIFIEKLKMVFPDLMDHEIIHKRLFREKHVQPLQELYYLDRQIRFRTPLQGVYLVNTSMIYNSTLNNNAVIELAHKAVDIILGDTENGSPSLETDAGDAGY